MEKELPLRRLVCEILEALGHDLRIQSSVLDYLQESAEAYWISLFEDTHPCIHHLPL